MLHRIVNPSSFSQGRKRKRSLSADSGEGSASDSDSSHSDGEKDEDEEKEEEEDDGEDGIYFFELWNVETLLRLQSEVFCWFVSERRKERGKEREKEAPPKPRPLHLTTSLFIRSIPPEVSKDEITAVRKRAFTGWSSCC